MVASNRWTFLKGTLGGVADWSFAQSRVYAQAGSGTIQTTPLADNLFLLTSMAAKTAEGSSHL